jgi:hypothetical protein
MRDKLFAMRVDRRFLQRIDNWRREQNDLPSRAEAVRRLVARALTRPDPTPRANQKPFAEVAGAGAKDIRAFSQFASLPMGRAERIAIRGVLRGPLWENYRKHHKLNKATMTISQLRRAIADLGLKVNGR